MSTLRENITIFLHIMVKHNPINKIKKKLCVYHGGLEYIWTKIIFVIVY
jgi:hypothetical protein